MNRGYFKPSFKQRLKNILFPDYIMQYLIAMRKVAYYSEVSNFLCGGGILLIINKIIFNRLSVKLGFSIAPKVFGYGLVIPHYGTIVVGNSNSCGNYCVLHTSTCITSNGKTIGDAMYLSTGAKITTKLELGDNVTIAANSLVNKSFPQGHALLVGTPAYVKDIREAWYSSETLYNNRVVQIEQLKKNIRGCKDDFV